MFVCAYESAGVSNSFSVGHIGIMVVLKGPFVTNSDVLCSTSTKTTKRHFSHLIAIAEHS